MTTQAYQANQPSATPSVPVFGPRALAWPRDDEQAPTPAQCMPIAQALTTAWPYDAHFQAVDSAFPFRLSSDAVLSPGLVKMGLFVVDVDAPEAHANDEPARDEWRAEERAKVEALMVAKPGCVYFETRGGYRLLWRLSEPLPLQSHADAELWKRLYTRALEQVGAFGITGDPRCSDWPHLFRLPFVVRDGQPQLREMFGDLSAGVWELDFDVPPLVVECDFDDGAEGDHPSGDRAIVDPLIVSIAKILAPQWEAGRQEENWSKTMFGWMKREGWSDEELLRLVEELGGTKPAKYLAAVRDARAHRTAGPGHVKELVGAKFPALDLAVRSHPNNAAITARRHAKRDEEQRESLAAIAASVVQAAPANETTPEVADAHAPVIASNALVDFFAQPWAAGLQKARNAKGLATGVQPNLPNTLHVVSQHPTWFGVVAYDEFANRIVVGRAPPTREQDRPSASALYPREWEAEDTTRTVAWISEHARFTPDVGDVQRAVATIARRLSFHPVRLYLDRLVWDGVPRLDAMLATHFGAVANEYTRAVGAKFAISAIARVMGPWPVKVDTMPILQGPQGHFKSTGLRVLFGDPWFSDTSIDFSSKDAFQGLRGKWCIEIAELDGFDRNDAKRVKAFMSSPSDHYRASYGEKAQDWPRHCVFAGTTNEEQYFQDRTGNRRYWPVAIVGRVDVEAIRRDRDQLWAEAFARWQRGEPWWLSQAQEALAVEEQAGRELVDSWDETIGAWLALEDRRGGVQLSAVLQGALKLAPAQCTPSLETRAAKTLKRLGYERTRRRDSADWRKLIWIYVPTFPRGE